MAYILGLDPGFASTGWALYDVAAKTVTCAGVIRTKKDPRKSKLAREDNVVRFNELFSALASIIGDKNILAIAAEGMSQPRNAAAGWKLALGWGALLGLAAARDIPVFQVAPVEIKKHLTGKRTASKAEVIAAIQELYPDLELPPQKTQQEHAADAVGVVLCVLDLPDVRLALRAAAA